MKIKIYIRRLVKGRRKEIKVLLLASFIFVVGFLVLSWGLDYKSLHPWDEAWYGVISRNVLRGHKLSLFYNTDYYWDLPPLGFYVTAISYRLFGINEFSTRLPMVVFGALCVALVFIVGKRLASSWVGVSAVLILFSSRWFLLRARTGNLESLLVFSQLLVFFLSWRARKFTDLILVWLAFGLSLMTKTIVSFALFPMVLAATISIFRKKKPRIKQLFILFIAFGLVVSPWYGVNALVHRLPFIRRHFFEVGLRSLKFGSLEASSLQRTLLYLRSAVHKWYLPMGFASILSILFIGRRNVRWVLSFLVLVSFPFLLSSRTEIWHLVPIAVPMSLIISIVFYEILELLKKLKVNVLQHRMISWLSPAAFVFVIVVIFFTSWKSYVRELYAHEKTVSDIAYLSTTARNYPGPLLLETFVDYSPTVVFYSDKDVILLNDKEKIEKIPKTQDRPFSLISNLPLVNKLACRVVASSSAAVASVCE
jgi:4-amino-4-deoxy-L-arabinose transferase-like glycosyltransferase